MTKKQKHSLRGSIRRNPWVDPDDPPEITDELLDRVWKNAEISKGGRVIQAGRPAVSSDGRRVPKVGKA